MNPIAERPRAVLGGSDRQDASPVVFDAGELQCLFQALTKRGYSIIGPTVRDRAIVLDRIESVDQLPRGWTDEQEPAHYRIERRDDDAVFRYATTAHSWKRYLHLPELKLWSAERQNGAFKILNNETKPQGPMALFGVRACELSAIAIQDRVLLGDKYQDPAYAARRKNLFIVAVQCSQSAATCFCASTGTGPGVGDGFDLCLTELTDAGKHRFVASSGSERGDEILADLDAERACDEDLRQVEKALDNAAHQQVRKIEQDGLKELLYRSFDSPRWDKIAARCLSCANCTMACPTCFCVTIEDTTDISGNHAERWRRWDSCFTLSFSYIHGGSIRASSKSRYRQWITHKLAAWIDQFGTPGCVGCGRCITWCPAGIDITAELRALKEG